MKSAKEWVCLIDNYAHEDNGQIDLEDFIHEIQRELEDELKKSEASRLYLYDRLEQYKDVVEAACSYVSADMYVHPILDREQAVKLGADKLIDAVQKFNSLQGQEKLA